MRAAGYMGGGMGDAGGWWVRVLGWVGIVWGYCGGLEWMWCGWGCTVEWQGRTGSGRRRKFSPSFGVNGGYKVCGSFKCILSLLVGR